MTHLFRRSGRPQGARAGTTPWRPLVAAALTISLAGAAFGGGARFTLALLTDTADVGANTFTTASSFTACTAASMPLWLTGLEHGVVSTAGLGLFNNVLTGGGAPVADAAVFRTGAYSLKVPKTGSTNTSYVEKAITASGVVVARFAIRLNSLPAADVTQLASITVTAGSQLNFGYQTSSQKLQVKLGSGAAVVANTTVTAGTWYVVELRFTVNSNPRTVEWQIGGAAQTNASAAETASTATNVRFGSAVNAEVFTANYDDIIVDNTSADYPFGAGRVQRLLPTGVDTASPNTPGAFTNSDSTAIDSTTPGRLDDVPMSGSTDYVRQSAPGTGNNYITLTFADTTETCINGVAAVLAYAGSGTAANNGQTRALDGATSTTVYSGAMNLTTLAYKSAVVTPTTAPSTTSTVNGAVVQIGYSTDINPVPYWHALVIEYDSE